MPEAVEFINALPHTATGKVQKMVLREMYKDYVFPE
jgi:fatty-acyl-CoA synthase